MATGRLFRYCGKGGAEGSDASVAEQMVADYVGAEYCIGVNSCSSAVSLSLSLSLSHIYTHCVSLLPSALCFCAFSLLPPASCCSSSLRLSFP